jgi:5,10-methylenetetrahydromethanopterin reductase
MSKSMLGTYARAVVVGAGHDSAMRIGLNGSSLIATGAPLGQLVDHAAQAEADGFTSYWLAQLGVPDALTAIATMGTATSSIEIGTAVIPTWPRHPLMLAAQALTVQEAIGPRLVLGIGLAHKSSVEGTFKIPFATPAKHMDEYLQVLLPALTDRKVSFTGDIWSAEADGIGGAGGLEPPTVMLAAMGPRMLRLAGARTAGSILWLSGPKAIAEQIKPALDAAAAEAGRPTPRIVASVPVCVTAKPDDVKGMVATLLEGYNDLPSYRGVMDTEGAGGPADVSLIGGADEVRAGLAAFADAGATDFAALEFIVDPADAAPTRALLQEVAAAG